MFVKTLRVFLIRMFFLKLKKKHLFQATERKMKATDLSVLSFFTNNVLSLFSSQCLYIIFGPFNHFNLFACKWKITGKQFRRHFYMKIGSRIIIGCQLLFTKSSSPSIIVSVFIWYSIIHGFKTAMQRSSQGKTF